MKPQEPRRATISRVNDPEHYFEIDNCSMGSRGYPEGYPDKNSKAGLRAPGSSFRCARPAPVLLVVLILVLFVGSGCYLFRTYDAKLVQSVETTNRWFAKYVAFANKSIDLDETLTAEEREEWKGIGMRCLRNYAALLEVLKK